MMYGLAARLAKSIIRKGHFNVWYLCHKSSGHVLINWFVRWFTSVTTEPVGLHLMLSPFHAQVAGVYLGDLAWALNAVLGGAAASGTEARYS